MSRLLTLASFLLVSLAAASPVAAASFTLSPSQTSIPVGSTANVTISIDTNSANTTGADAIINFDSNILEIQSVTFTSPYAQNFNRSSTGTISLSGTEVFPSDYFNGNQAFATVTLKALSTGTTSLTFACQSGSTNDTNIIQRLTSNDLIDCSSLNTSTITVTSDASDDSSDDTPDDDNNDTSNDSTNNSSDTSDNSDSSCPTPPAPTNLRSAPNGSDSILLTWDHVTNTSYYSLEYGTKPGTYIYGIGNLGYTNNFLVNFLKPSTTYYFAVKSRNDCGGASSAATTTNTTDTNTSTTRASTTPTPVPTGPSSRKLFGTNTPKTNPNSQYLANLVTDEPVLPTPAPDTTPQPYQEPQPQPQLSTLAKLGAILVLVLTLPLALVLLSRLGRKPRQPHGPGQIKLQEKPITPSPTNTSTTQRLHQKINSPISTPPSPSSVKPVATPPTPTSPTKHPLSLPDNDPETPDHLTRTQPKP